MYCYSISVTTRSLCQRHCILISLFNDIGKKKCIAFKVSQSVYFYSNFLFAVLCLFQNICIYINCFFLYGIIGGDNDSNCSKYNCFCLLLW